MAKLFSIDEQWRLASDLHCLLITVLGVPRLNWVDTRTNILLCIANDCLHVKQQIIFSFKNREHSTNYVQPRSPLISLYIMGEHGGGSRLHDLLR